MQTDVVGLQNDLEDRRKEAADMIHSVESQMQTWEQAILSRMLQPLKRHSEAKEAAEKAAGELRGQLLTEQEERHKDNLDSGRKYGSLQTDKDDLTARTARECAQLSQQLQALERRQLEERQSWAEERSRLERHCNEQQQLLSTRRAMLDQLQRDVVVAETAASSAASESRGLEQVSNELRRQARESEDALAAAVSSNKHLRAQMEEQRTRAQETNASDLSDCRNTQEQRVHEQRIVEEVETTLMARQTEAMEIEVSTCNQELSNLAADEEAADKDLAALQDDLGLWKSKCDGVNASREALEKDFNDAKRQFHSDLLTVQTVSDRLVANAQDLEKDMQLISVEIQNRRRSMVSREAESATRQAAAEGQLKEAQELLESCRERLRDAAEQRAKANAEAEAGRHKAIETLSLLERHLESQVQALYGERERYEALLDSEKRNHEQAREDCERERDLVSLAVRHARDENRVKLEGAEKERAKIEETRRSEILQANEYVAYQQRHMEELERDVGRVRALATESDSNLTFIRQECLQEERDGVRVQRDLEEEIHDLNSQLDRARRDEASLVKQAEVQRFRSDQERQDLRRGLHEATGVHSATSTLGSQQLSPNSRRRTPAEPVTVR